MEFKDQVVLITGGSRGIGAAISQAFADRGAQIAINYRENSKRAHALAEELPGEGHLPFRSDISTKEGCQSLVRDVLGHYQKVDILVNNAGIHEKHPIEKVEYNDWDRIFMETLDTNLMAPARLMYLVARTMMDQGGGKIVNISSRGAFRGEPDQPAYGASKAGLNQLSQSLAQKLAPYKIHIGVVAPCFTQTEMVKDILDSPEGDKIRAQSPFGRVAQPDEVAHAVLFLASAKAAFSSGAIIDVNGASYLRS